MAINKAKSSPLVKVGSILLALVFVLGGVTVNAASCSSAQQGQTPGTQANTLEGVAAQYDPGLKALQEVVRSEPTSYTALVNLGNFYLDYASAINGLPGQQQQPTPEAQAKISQMYSGARDVYGAALKINDTDPLVHGDYAISLYNVGEREEAIKVANDAVKKFPDAAIVWLKLGDFNSSYVLGSTSTTSTAGYRDAAVRAYEQYLKLDPSGQYASFANQQIQALKGAQTGTQPTAPNANPNANQ